MGGVARRRVVGDYLRNGDGWTGGDGMRSLGLERIPHDSAHLIRCLFSCFALVDAYWLRHPVSKPEDRYRIH